MKTFIGFKKDVVCKGFSAHKTPKGLFITTSWGNQFYVYPKDSNYGYYLKEYIKYANK